MLQKSTHKYIVTIVIIALLQVSMVKFSNRKNCKNKVTVTGSAMLHRPYCGGAYPPPELMYGTDSPIKNADFFVVKKGDTLERKVILKFTTSKEGTFNFKIKTGEYWIFTKDKMQNYTDFYNQNTTNLPNNAVLYQGSCIRKWYNTPEFELSANRDTTFQIIIYSSCFVGINPCLQYTGPMPQ